MTRLYTIRTILSIYIIMHIPRYLIFLIFISVALSCSTATSTKNLLSPISILDENEAATALVKLGLGDVYIVPISSNTIKVFNHLQAYSGSLLIGNKTSQIILPGYFDDHIANNVAVYAAFILQNQGWNRVNSKPILFNKEVSIYQRERPLIQIEAEQVVYTRTLNHKESFSVSVTQDSFAFKASSEPSRAKKIDPTAVLSTSESSFILPWLKSPQVSVDGAVTSMEWILPEVLYSYFSQINRQEQVVSTPNLRRQASNDKIWVVDKDGSYEYTVTTGSTEARDQLELLVDRDGRLDILLLNELVKRSSATISLSMFCPLESSTPQEYLNAVQKIQPDILDLSLCPDTVTSNSFQDFLAAYKNRAGSELAVYVADIRPTQTAH